MVTLWTIKYPSGTAQRVSGSGARDKGTTEEGKRENRRGL